MKKFLQNISYIRFPVDAGRVALFFSILALAFVASASNTKCLSASTCAVGSDPTFEQNIALKGGTAFAATLDASLLTNDRNIQLPDTSGILAVTSTLSGNKMLRTNISGDIEVDITTYPVTLLSSLPLSTSATGEVTAGAFDVTDLGIGAGTSNQVLGVNAGQTALSFSTFTGVPVLTANKPLISDGLGTLTTASITASQIMATDINGNLSTSSIYPLVLSADTPLKTDSSGNVITGSIDVDNLSPGSAVLNDELRLGSSGSWESFTPSGGGVYTLIDSGNLIANSSDSAEVLTCWYGNVLDGTKRYKLIFDGGTGWNVGGTGYRLKYEPIEGDCSTGTKNEWEASAYYQSSGRTEGSYSGNTGPFKYANVSTCYTVLDSNSSTLRANNTQGYLSFSAFDNGNGYGLWSEGTVNGIIGDGSGNVIGSLFSSFGCIVMQNSTYNNPFADITGFQWYFEGGNGVSAPLTRSWALYEISY